MRLLSSSVLVAGLMVATTCTTPAQKLDFLDTGAPLKVAPVDPQIAAALKDVSPARIRKNIETLVNFQNRSTLSSTAKSVVAAWK